MAAAAGAAIGQIGGAWLGGKAANKAPKQAAEQQTKMTALNNALAQWNYQQNAARLDPYAAGGIRAGNTLQSALGLGGPPAGGSTLPGGGSAYFPGAPGGGIPYEILALNSNGIKGDYEPALQRWQAQQAAAQGQQPGVMPGATVGGADNPASTKSALDQFLESTNYTFNFSEGQRALNNGLGATMMDSGDAREQEIRYGANTARNAIGDWMQQLYQQQTLGANAAGNLAGVGNTLMQSMQANNQASADANANRALIGGNNAANLWGNVGSGIGKIAGAWGSSYGNTGGGSGYGGNTGSVDTSGNINYGSYQPFSLYGG